MFFSFTVTASGPDIGGSLEQDIIYDDDTSETIGISKISLELKQDYGFDKHLYLNPEFSYTYDENNDSSEFVLKEGYLDFYLSDADLRIGRQFINWGTAYELNPTDMINPIDYTDEDPFEASQAVDAISIKYYLSNNMELSGVLVGNYVQGEVSESSRKYSFTKTVETILQKNPNAAVNPIPKIEEEPEIKGLDDAEYGLNFTKRNFKGYDLSLSYFKGYEDTPTLTTNIVDIIKGRESQLVYEYKETQAVGFNAIGSIGQYGVWSEANYAFNEDNEKTFDIILGGDYTFENNLYTVGQLFHRDYNDYQLNPDDINYLICYTDKPFRQIHKWEASFIYDLDNNQYLLNPQLDFSLANNVKLNFGTVINSGFSDLADNSLLKMLGKEKSYLELVYSF